MNFGQPGYWDLRYETASADPIFKLFDWYAPFDLCYPTVESLIDLTKQHRILIIGIGNSGAIETLWKKGFRDIVAIDISPTIIRQMQQKYSTYSGVEFISMDVRKMNIFPDNSFSVVMDKACLDALFCEIDYEDSVRRALSEIHRVMNNEGVFTSISHARPVARVPYFRHIKWSVEVLPLQEGCGDGLSLIAACCTGDQTRLQKVVKGAEFADQAKSSHTVYSLDQRMSKHATVRKPEHVGSLTITAIPEALAEMVRLSASQMK